jgi:hypothetical protein
VLAGAGGITANATEPQKKGGWFDNAMNFGNTLVSGAKSLGQSALDLGSNAYKGAANWVNEHKADIAIGVGIAALAAATILTGGAALAVAGAVAGGAAVSAGTVATVVAGGAAVGAGANLIQQGAAIKDGKIDPATGQKKTDINFGDVAMSGVYGGALAPVGAAALGLAPAVVGVAAVGGIGVSGVNAYNNFTGNNFLTNNNPYNTKNNWSGMADIGNMGMSALPFAMKGGGDKNWFTGGKAFFGKDAMAQTGKTFQQAGQSFLNAGDKVTNFILGGNNKFPPTGMIPVPVGGGMMPTQAPNNYGPMLGKPQMGTTAVGQSGNIGNTTNNVVGGLKNEPLQSTSGASGGGQQSSKPSKGAGSQSQGKDNTQSNTSGATGKTSASADKVNEWKKNNQITGDLKDLQKRLNSPDKGNRLGAEAEVRAYEQRIKNGEIPEVQGNKAGTDFSGDEIKARTEPFANEKQAKNFFADRIKKANSQYTKQGTTGTVTIDLGTQGTIDGKIMTKDMAQKLVQQSLSKGNRGSEITEVVVIDGNGKVIYTGKGE